ncbi:MAG: polysaccharide biosynthesis/export family protein [Pseudomonadota bacterium]
MKMLMGRWVLIGLLPCWATALLAQDNAGYTLALGDVISINVFDEPDLSQDRVLITDTGKIPFTFLGEVQATGRTVLQVQEAIADGLKPDYLVEPKVSVSVVEYRPFFLTGEVEEPGSIPYQPGLTLRQAIPIAGGLTERASEGRITVISGGKTNAPVKIDLNYEIKPGDTITIGESFF